MNYRHGLVPGSTLRPPNANGLLRLPYSMDVPELERALIAGRHRGWFLTGGQLDDTVTLNRTRDGWEVYYSERGKKSDVRTFRTEDEACRHFLAYISGGSSTTTGDKY